MRTESSGVAGALDLSPWFAWFADLDRTFVFLLVLPLVVAAVGLWAHLREGERDCGEGEGRGLAGPAAGAAGTRGDAHEG